jgi:hypothetical protein
MDKSKSKDKQSNLPPKIQELIEKAYLLDIEDARIAGRLGFIARALVQATMPHSKPEDNEFERRNGDFYLAMWSPRPIGLPYGALPRLIMAWITSEAVKTKNRELVLGDSLSAFMRELKLVPTGGRWGSIIRLKNQMKRLLSCAISCTYDNGGHWAIQNMTPVETADLWWTPKNPNQRSLWQSTLTLNNRFFDEITSNPVPVRMEVLEALKSSSMALDVYCWLTYRNSYAKKLSRIPWEGLQLQFGAGYPMTLQGKRDFKKKFIGALRRVALFYAEASRLVTEEDVLIFMPGYPDIPKSETKKSTRKVNGKIVHA